MSEKKGKAAPPKLHKFMHPRNPYKTPPIFKNLAQKYASFRAHCSYGVDGKIYFNFKDPLALRELTTCLLDQDFGLKVNIPEGRLVPTLPLRFNYLLWIEDLLNLSGDRSNQKDNVIGLDIGCGASCVYPLLAAKQNGWCMVATEADDVNFDSAMSNVKNSDMESQIKVHKVNHVIFQGVLDNKEVIDNVKSFEEEKTTTEMELQPSCEKTGNGVSQQIVRGEEPLFDFTMCNPPFFGSVEETDSMSKSKRERAEPVSVATGAVQETVTEGGEVAFISQMIDESLLFKEKVRIFSTMIGTKAHVKEVKDKLRSVSPAHMAVVEFCQGRTMRWGIAWTFDSRLHLSNVLSKKQMVDAKPLVLRLPRTLMTVYTVQAAWGLISKWLHQLKINVQVFKSNKFFVGANIKAYKPTWLHQRRKKRERERKQADFKDKNLNGKGKEILEDAEETVCDEPSLKRTAADADFDGNSSVEEERKRQRTSDLNDSSGTDRCDTDPDKEDIILGQTSHVSLPKLKDSQDVQLDSEADMSLEMEESDETQKGSISISDMKTKEEPMGEEVITGLECILRAKLQVKQCGSLISMEALYLRGSAGKDGVNQILQYMRNQLSSS